MKKGNLLIAAALVCCGIVTSCQNRGVEIKTVECTMDEPFGLDSASDEIRGAMSSLVTDSRYELVFEDSLAGIAVWSLMRLNDETSSEGMGVMVVKDGKATAFPDIHHGNQPSAQYDDETQTLRLVCGEMEGTGVCVERLYLLCFAEDGTARILQSIDPYDMQQALRQRLGYSIDGQCISFYDQKRLLCSVTDTVTDMGGFDEDPIWIGEQLRYRLSGNRVHVLCTPGLKYVTGLVLNYDAMPTIAAYLTINSDGSFSLEEIVIDE